MPEHHPTCQLDNPATGDSPRISIPGQRNQNPTTASGAASWTIVLGEEQELAATLSRRTGPRRWLRAVIWLISASLHPRANATTLRVAEDLTTRMDFDTGHAVYDLEGTAARLGIDKATVKRHARYLRELGALVWVSHGTQHNSRRARGLKGYAGTATIYAATIPPAFDHAMGHRLIGEGYEARIVIDQRGQAPVDNAGRAPLSLTVDKEEGKLKMMGGVTTTGKPAATESTSTTKTASKRKRVTTLGGRVTAAGAQLADQLARTLRNRFPWLRRASHDQVRWVCADMGERGWTVAEAIQLASDTAAIQGRNAGVRWQPDRPHALLAVGLRAHEDQRLDDQRRMDQMLSALPESSTDRGGLPFEALSIAPTVEEPREPYTDEERRTARAYGWGDFAMVADAYDVDPDDAVDLYGTQLIVTAQNQTRRQEVYA